MKVYKKIVLGLIVIWLASVAWIYLTSARVTFIVPKGYEGSLLIISNQPNGIAVDRQNIVYDFTKSNILLIKNSLDTGFTPAGYTNYYFWDKKNNKIPIEVTDDIKKKPMDNNLYVWDNYYQIGGCELKSNTKLSYEVIVLASPRNLNKVLDERDSILFNICNMRRTGKLQ